MDCKALIFNAERQEVITPIYPNRLVKWSIFSTPVIIDEIELPYTFKVIPEIVLLPNHRFVIAPAETMLTPCLYLREWSDWKTFERIEIPSNMREKSSNKMHISCLSLTPCKRDLVLNEGWGDMYLYSLATKQWRRWARDWDDYAMAVAFDSQRVLMAINESCTDAYPLLFRIEDPTVGKFTYLEQFGADLRCHQGALSFSLDGELIMFTRHQHTNGKRQIELVIWQVDRAACMQTTAESDGETDDKETDDETKGLKEIWRTALPLPQAHDALNPWQSDAIWLGKEWIAFAAGSCLAKVNVLKGTVESTVNITEVINAIVLDTTLSHKIIIATKNGIKIQQL